MQPVLMEKSRQDWLGIIGEAGVPVAICCDNSTVSRTDQVKESLFVASEIGVDASARVSAIAALIFPTPVNSTE